MRWGSKRQCSVTLQCDTEDTWWELTDHLTGTSAGFGCWCMYFFFYVYVCQSTIFTFLNQDICISTYNWVQLFKKQSWDNTAGPDWFPILMRRGTNIKSTFLNVVSILLQLVQVVGQVVPVQLLVCNCTDK